MNCEAIHEIQKLIPLDLMDPQTYSVHIQKVYFTQGQSDMGGASTADISVKNGSHKTASRHNAQLPGRYHAVSRGHELRL